MAAAVAWRVCLQSSKDTVPGGTGALLCCCLTSHRPLERHTEHKGDQRLPPQKMPSNRADRSKSGCGSSITSAGPTAPVACLLPSD